MEYIQLGNSDLKVSKVCLGCMSFGNAQSGMHSWTLPEDESRKIIKYALDNGINFFDTSGNRGEKIDQIIKEIEVKSIN